MGELMKLFFGTKLVAAKPMTLGTYNKYRGLTAKEGEDQTRAGYLVEYLGSGDKNHPDHEHYISWSPAETFDKANICVGGHSTLSSAPHVQLLMAEHVDHVTRLAKLHTFRDSEQFENLPTEERHDIVDQIALMVNLTKVLERRVRRAGTVEVAG